MDLFLFFLGGLTFISLLFSVRRRKVKLPPGPRGYPIIGNILDISPTSQWVAYHSWSRKYNSPIIHVSVAGSHLIALDKYEVAIDLLDNRSIIYSSRPRIPFAGELMGWNEIFPLMPYGTEWRTQRRLFSTLFSPRPVQRYRAVQTCGVNRFLKSLLSDPEAYSLSIRRLNASTLLTIAYGSSKEEYIHLAEAAAHSLSDALVPGAFLVDFIPILKWIPEWVPGAGFQKKARIWSQMRQDAHEKPFVEARAAAASTAANSFVAQSLTKLDGYDSTYLEKEKEVELVAGAMYIAGTDSMTVALHNLFLAMIRYPEICKDVQKELDDALQGSRLPNYPDMDCGRFPKVTAFMWEILRYFLISPLGLPHLLEQDDVYMGQHLPKGALVFANLWAMLHDENDYPEPFVFNPYRFIDGDGKINNAVRCPVDIVYGFGRRQCPGKHMSLATIYLAIACVLYCYDIGYAMDENGKPLPVEEKYSDESTVLMPVPFKCTITPRSPVIRDLVGDSQDD